MFFHTLFQERSPNTAPNKSGFVVDIVVERLSEAFADPATQEIKLLGFSFGTENMKLSKDSDSFVIFSRIIEELFRMLR